ncbi:nucleotide-binding universal stress UspA family protein [Salibacterium salarium]|uniref:universal stress protein n=1 Tax=Salibacterium salarium TaxID=284579 RepID=UPI002781AF31|nr:universal stress protein [Salibacterium salarium]MDQ0298570.1 nucleotide-binding universal stress UspA family protein [Salibacterium salarium]
MAKYNNVLVAVDGSDESKIAFKKALDLAKENSASLTIVHIIDTRTFATIEQYDRTIVSRAENYGQELLEQYEEEAKQTGIEDVATVIDFGSPKSKIPKDIAKQYNIDLIITGATGLNAVERMLIGSVSEAIARQAACDVLIVRSP